MVIRGDHRTTRLVDFVSGERGWTPVQRALLVHPTLPWWTDPGGASSIPAMPLEASLPWGLSDRLSLFAQHAAHLEFLSFCGIPDGPFTADDWAIQRDRSHGVRLVRIRAPEVREAETPAQTSLQSMAAFLSLGNETLLETSWTGAGWIYRDVAMQLGERSGSWLRRCAVGFLREPGMSSMRDWLSGSCRLVLVEDPGDRRAIASVVAETIDLRIVGEGASPLTPFSAWSDVMPAPGDEQAADESRLAERLVERFPSASWVVMNAERFDARSRLLGTILAGLQTGARWISDGDSAAWLGLRGSGHASEPPRVLVISPRLSASLSLGSRIAQIPLADRVAWMDAFCHSDAWLSFVSEALPPASVRASTAVLPPEPAQSFIAALALAGRSVRREVALQILSRLGSAYPLDDLAFPDITTAGSSFVFESEDVRRAFVEQLPQSARAGLASMVAEVVATTGRDRLGAASILLEHRSEDPLGALLLSEALLDHPREAAELAARQPPRRLAAHPVLLHAAARHRIAEARYVDARAFARELGSEGARLLALIERRLGHYHEALAILPESAVDVESTFLRAELLRLTGARNEARALLDRPDSSWSESDRVRAEYERWILDPSVSTPALDAAAESYWSQRRDAYAAMASRDYATAIERSRTAAVLAPDTGCAIDSSLDELACLFLAGEWETARHSARLLLRRIERTQGDRAAIGALLIFGFVCADSGLAEEAGLATERLRSFLLHDGDAVRILESELLRAATALAGGRWNDARTSASAVLLAETLDSEIRAAAAWIDGEAAWAAGDPLELHPALFGAAGRELRDRAALLEWRAGGSSIPVRPFLAALARWDRRPEQAPPSPENGADRMMLARSQARAGSLSTIRDAAPLGVASSRRTKESSSRVHRIATEEFPPAPAMGVTLVNRNRLGRWSFIGSEGAPSPEVVAAIEGGSPFWTSLDDSTWAGVNEIDPGSGEHHALVAVLALRLERWKSTRLRDQNARSVAPAPCVDGFVGSSPALASMRSTIARIAPRAEIPVTLIGESGTGKELAAVAIHKLSPRRSKAFVPVNCAAIAEHLIESELFGHVRGAFTGADRDRVGLLEMADGGTLFLDEIGEMPAAAQAKLLRFLQEKEFRRVGESAVRRADVRIVAATHRQLEVWVDEGRFRGDLFYRIRGIEITLPPLRERQEDILEIARWTLDSCVESSGGAARFSHEVEAVFLSWNWPGNVRELQQTIRAAHALAGDGGTIELEHLPERMRGLEMRRTITGSYYVELTRFRRSLIERSLDAAGGNQSQAARTLGMTRQALAYQIRELGILVRKD